MNASTNKTINLPCSAETNSWDKRLVAASNKLQNATALRGWAIFSLVAVLLFFSVAGAFKFDNVFAWAVGITYVIYDTWLLSYVAWKTRKLGSQTTTNKTLKNSDITNKPSPRIGVLVPVHNESDVIIDTMSQLLAQSDSPEQIIIVNDGSGDDTQKKLEKAYGFSSQNINSCQPLSQSQQYPHLFLLNKENSGKADSMNQALKYLECDLVMTVDADTLLEPQATHEVRLAFINNPKLVAACGILKPISNGNIFSRILVGLQYFEYLRAFLSRAAWSQSNALLLVSGAFSAYNKQALIRVGGYDDSSLVEDYELIHRMHKYSNEHNLNWQIDVIENARATTDAPTNVFAFIQQRKRWFAGFLRTQFKYRNMIGSSSYHSVGRFMLPIKTVDTMQPIFGLVALYLLILFALTDIKIAGYVLVVISVKLLIDYSFHIWSLYKYHTWLGQEVPNHRWWQATLCCLVDPFFFQPLRHISALVGWSMVLKGNVRWEPIRIKTKN